MATEWKIYMIRFEINTVVGASDIIPVMVGRADCPPEIAYGQFTKDNYVILACLSGSGVVRSSSGRHYVKGGEMFVVHPMEDPSYTTDPDNPWFYVWIAFNGKRAEIFDRETRIRKTPPGIG